VLLFNQLISEAKALTEKVEELEGPGSRSESIVYLFQALTRKEVDY
jgi:hypothetical protein